MSIELSGEIKRESHLRQLYQSMKNHSYKESIAGVITVAAMVAGAKVGSVLHLGSFVQTVIGAGAAAVPGVEFIHQHIALGHDNQKFDSVEKDLSDKV